MERERPTTINRVIHKSPKVKDAVMERMRSLFVEVQDITRPGERKKSAIEGDIITSISQYMKPFVEQYGGTYVPLTPSHTRILSQPELFADTDRANVNAGAHASFDLREQKTTVFDDGNMSMSLLRFTTNQVHEMLHANSYQSVIAHASGNQISFVDHRSGLYFDNPGSTTEHTETLDEVITEQLTKRFMDQYESKLPHVQGQVKMKRKIIDETGDETIAFPIMHMNTQGNRSCSSVGFYTHKQEWGKIKEKISEMAEKTDGNMDQEDIFGLFARAYFTHDMQPLSSTVNKTFGPGSMKKLLHQ